jgi:hypothetical protein
VSAPVESPRPLVIAIDGPSGAGKGTVARAVAQRLRYRHIDTGAMYRAVAWKALQEGIDLANEDAVAALSERAGLDLGDGRVTIDGHDVARAIRTPEIDAAATAVARLPAVRRVLVDRQRAMGAGGAVVMEGRDIQTARERPGASGVDRRRPERRRDRARGTRQERLDPRRVSAVNGAGRRSNRDNRPRHRRRRRQGHGGRRGGVVPLKPRSAA